jgi:hypothetical protein
VELRSRHHAQIRPENERPPDVVRVGNDCHQTRAFDPIADRRQDAPAVERREPEVEDDRVEPFVAQPAQRVVAVGGDDRLGILDVGSVLDREHARDHRAPPP